MVSTSPDRDPLLLHHLAEVFGGAATPVVVDDEEIDLLQFELVDDALERRGLDRRRRRDAEDVGIAGRGDLARRGGLDHHRRFVFHQLGHHGQRQARAPRAHQDRHLVAGDQLFSDGGGFRRIALVVLDDEFEFLAENAALGVDLIGRDLGAVDDIGAGSGERAREGLVDADLDGLGLGGPAQEGNRQRDRRNNSESPFHVLLQSHAVDLSAVQTSSFRITRKRRSITALRLCRTRDDQANARPARAKDRKPAPFHSARPARYRAGRCTRQAAVEIAGKLRDQSRREIAHQPRLCRPAPACPSACIRWKDRRASPARSAPAGSGFRPASKTGCAGRCRCRRCGRTYRPDCVRPARRRGTSRRSGRS